MRRTNNMSYVKLLKDELDQTYVVIFEMGKFRNPTAILHQTEFEDIIKQYKKKMKELKKPEEKEESLVTLIKKLLKSE